MTIKTHLVPNSPAATALAGLLGLEPTTQPQPLIPCVLMVERASIDTVIQALRAPYRGLIEIGESWGQAGQQMRHHLESGGLGLSLRTDTAYNADVVPEFCQALNRHVRDKGLVCPADLELVVHEGLANAMIHGNLEVNATTSGAVEDMLHFGDMVEHALETPILAQRRIWLSASLRGHLLHIAIEDQGPGCPISSPHPHDRPHGLELISQSVTRMSRDSSGRTLVLELALEQRSLPRQAFAHARILVVDDNPFNRRMLQALLQSLGVGRIETANDGIEGLAAIAANPPDLVLLDVMMPNMDGLDMCRHLRADHALLDLPVLFITALDDPKSRTACFAAGGNDVISKPIDADEVLARVKVHLQNALLLSKLNAYRDRVREELEAARTAQATLSPTPAQLAALQARTGLIIQGMVENSSELGGDFWTVFEAGPHHLGVLVTDFAGHGLPAAFNVFRLHVLLSRLPRRPPPPAAMMTRLNGELKALLKPGEFAAIFIGLVDLQADTLTYAGAATPPPVLIGAGQPQFLEVSGPPLGAFADAEYEEHCIAFPPGSGLLIYSDALTESEALGRLVCDENALLDWIEEIAPADGLINTILKRFHTVIPGEPPDDLTLVHLRRPA